MSFNRISVELKYVYFGADRLECVVSGCEFWIHIKDTHL